MRGVDPKEGVPICYLDFCPSNFSLLLQLKTPVCFSYSLPSPPPPPPITSSFPLLFTAIIILESDFSNVKQCSDIYNIKREENFQQLQN